MTETVFHKLGRLKTAIKEGKNDRALNLLEVIIPMVAKMDIDIMHYEKELKN